jgi:hypothetical protein
VDDLLPLEMISRWKMEDGSGNTQAARPSQLSSRTQEGRQRRLQDLNALASSISNMKDAVAYCGVFGKGKVR